MTIRKLGALLLTVLVCALVFTPGAARATNGAQFTSLSAEYVNLGVDDDDHRDDLLVTFTETGIGNSKVMDIAVSAIREISITCVSANGGGIVLSTEETVPIRFPDQSSEPSATFTSDDNGTLTGTIPLHTSLQGYWSEDEETDEWQWERGDVCPKEENLPGAYVLKDYAITYTDLTVIDNENGGASASIARVEDTPGGPGYRWDDLVMFGANGEVFGFSCTVDSESGGCGSD